MTRRASTMFMTKTEILALLGWGRSKFQLKLAAGEFPPASLGRGNEVKQWRRAVVNDWLAARERANAAR